MPELPEVETVAAGLRQRVLGATIQDVVVGRTSFVRCASPFSPTDLRGLRIQEIARHGKRLEFILNSPARLRCHLGMTGRINVLRTSEAIEPHTHMRLRLDSGEFEIRFRDPRRFGGVWITGDASSLPNDLGPDMLEISATGFCQRLDRARKIKALLLDQSQVAGLGNIYCDEGLFDVGIHPSRIARDLSKERRMALYRALQRILRAAIRSRGSTLRDYATVEGGTGSFQMQHRVYGREGQACVRCGRVIRRIQEAGRSTHVCTRCQAPPRKKKR